MENVSMNKDVLVIGGDLTGVGTAVKIADAGYTVVFAKQEEKPDSSPASLLGVSEPAIKSWQKTTTATAAKKKLEVLENTRLVKAAGVAGDYTVRLAAGDTVTERTVGAIVVATDQFVQPLHEAYGLTLSSEVLSLSQMEEKIAAGAVAGLSVGFLAGLAQNGNPLNMQRIFKSVRALGEAGGTAAVYVDDLKLADNGLDRLYKEGRDKGAVYFKMKEPPAIDGTTLRFMDNVLGQEVETTHDLLVVDENIVPDAANAALAEILEIHRTPSGFLQKDNVHRFPVNTNRRGIYVAGNARNMENVTDCVTDADNVVLELATLFRQERVTDRIAVVDREKCAICLTCYRCCPHGAIYWDDKAVISPVACQGCGICASECPQEAIQLELLSDDDITSQIKEGLGTTPAGMVVFGCENSAVQAAATARQFGLDLPDNLIMVEVPCAGKVDLSYILTAFVEGAAGVLVMACHDGNCKSEYGSNYARWRVQEVLKMLDETGIDRNRLAFVTLAANMAPDFAGAVNEMKNRLG